jgi:putative addiction module CopG family antidote
MTITLTDEMERMITAKVQSGAYQSAEEVMMASLLLLDAKEQGIEALRREITKGIVDIEEGRFTNYDGETDGDAFARDIISRGQEKLKESEINNAGR